MMQIIVLKILQMKKLQNFIFPLSISQSLGWRNGCRVARLPGGIGGDTPVHQQLPHSPHSQVQQEEILCSISSYLILHIVRYIGGDTLLHQQLPHSPHSQVQQVEILCSISSYLILHIVNCSRKRYSAQSAVTSFSTQPGVVGGDTLLHQQLPHSPHSQVQQEEILCFISSYLILHIVRYSRRRYSGSPAATLFSTQSGIQEGILCFISSYLVLHIVRYIGGDTLLHQQLPCSPNCISLVKKQEEGTPWISRYEESQHSNLPNSFLCNKIVNIIYNSNHRIQMDFS